MTNHVHLLVTPGEEKDLSYLMRYFGSHYVQYVNYAYRRSGTLWEGRFKSDRFGSVFADVLSVHRIEPCTSRDGSGTWRLQVVELSAWADRNKYLND